MVQLAVSFSQDFIESVRDAGDIVRLVGDYVRLKPSGARMKGLCPFHEEKTPSFSVDPQRQLFYCFGCQAGGDAFKFVQLYEKVNFREAVELLADRYGVPRPQTKGNQEEASDRLRRMNREAATYFCKRLADPKVGASCRRYLEQRGIGPEVTEQLALGYAVDGWEGLRSYLSGKGFREAEMLAGGLVLQRKSGQGCYDRFRDRLVFPIRDVSGRPVAFGGRILGDAQPKYINSPETPVYTKGHHLYGLDLARDAIRQEGFVIVVEGYLDLLAVVQAGIPNVVASLGTAFTPQQVRLLARHANRVVMSYDGDAAGATATERSIDLLLNRGFAVRVVELPKGNDPDDFIKAHGADAYATLVREAPEYLQFLIQREARGRDLRQTEEKVAAANAVLPHIVKLTSAIERAAWSTRLADALMIDEDLVLQELRAALKNAKDRIRQRPAEDRRISDAEARLVALLLRSEDERETCLARIDWEDLAGSPVEPVVRKILEAQQSAVDYPKIRAELEETEQDLLTRIAFRDDPEDGPTIVDCLDALKRRRLAKEGRTMRRELGRMEQESVDQQLLRLQEIARQRDQLLS